MYWHKRLLAREDLLLRSEVHVGRSALSFLTGYKAYLHSSDLAWIRSVGERVNRLVEDVDVLIERADAAALSGVRETLRYVEDLVGGERVLTDGGERQAAAVGLIRSLREAFDRIAAGDIAALEAHTTSDADFIAGWGMPNHVGVFCKYADITQP